MRRNVAPATNPPGGDFRSPLDSRLERKAFEQLDRLDLGRCRSAFRALVDGIESSPEHERATIQLLEDTLQNVNRRLHALPEDQAIFQSNRVALVDEFSACQSLDLAIKRFDASLDRLLGSLPTVGRAEPSLIKRARVFIRNNYRKRLSLSTVAGALHISPNHLSRLFRRETGVTLTSYVHQVRLSQATRLLSRGGYTLSEIADLSGYRSYRDFHRNLVKYERVSPGELQRRLRQRVEAAPRSD